MKIAIVYDWIDKWGGVERLLLTLHELYPQADWYTSAYDSANAPWASDLSIQTSFIQRLPGFIKKNRLFSLPFYGLAFESFDFSAYDIVFSITSSFAKAVITRPPTKHICYMLTPTRYLWGMTDLYLSQRKQMVLSLLLANLRKEDYIYAQRPDKILTLSTEVKVRIEKYYHREAEILFPPFDTDYWDDMIDHQVTPTGFNLQDYYLVVSRLEPYKRVDLVLKAFHDLKDKHIVIVGTGSLASQLKNYENSHIQFIDDISDEELSYLYSHAKALIMPQIEDFGYVSLEAQYHECPVLAFQGGGALDTVVEGQNGLLFSEATEESVRSVVARFEAASYNMRSQLKTQRKTYFKKFDKQQFIQQLKKTLST